MPIPSPFHERTAALCQSYRWKEWAGYYAVCAYDHCHEPEYLAVRHATGLLDVTPLFKYSVIGPDAAAFLARVMCRDIRKLKPGRVAYCSWCDERGKILDDGTVACLREHEYRVTSAEPAYFWLQRNRRGFQVTIEDITDDMAALALQGPTSKDLLSAATDADMSALKFFGHTSAQMDDLSIEITRTGFTGDLGYEIWGRRSDALRMWDALMKHGKAYGIQPIGLDALDMSRVEAGFILQGVDYFSAKHCITEAQTSTPFELDLGWTVQLNREPFVGSKVLQAEKDAGVKRLLVGLDIDWPATEALFERFGLPPGIPGEAWRDGKPVYQGRRQVGRATSGTWSPILKKNVALATVDVAYTKPGTQLDFEITVEYERHTVPCTVVQKPFFDPERKRS